MNTYIINIETFADDLLLCVEASFSQARTMEHIMATFCAVSGQYVNWVKSRIWLSLNTLSFIRNVICLEFKVLRTKDLGSYLGIPLLHDHMRLSQYNFLVEKVDKRLAG